jgi:hypothetical protein
MPYGIEGTHDPDWGAENVDSNADQLDYLLGKNPNILETFSKGKNSWDLLYTKDGLVDVYFVHDEGIIQYCVEVETIQLTGLVELTTVAQTSVWRNKEYLGLYGLADWVFSTILYPKYDSIISDNTQSKDGKNFWGHRVSSRIEHNKPVYGLELKGRNNRYTVNNVVPIEDVSDMRAFYTRGSDYTGLDKRLLLIEQPLGI